MGCCSKLGDIVPELRQKKAQTVVIVQQAPQVIQQQPVIMQQPAMVMQQPAQDRLLSGTSLSAGGRLQSGQYRFEMQGDGNLVLYRGSQAIWAADINGRGGVSLQMQQDGNLVVYNAANQPVWASNTNGRAVGGYLIMQGDGNVVLYDQTNRPIWNTCTHGNVARSQYWGAGMLN